MKSGAPAKKIIIAAAVLALVWLASGIYRAFYGLPSRDELIESSKSPSGRYAAHVWRNNGSATVGYSVIVDAEDTETGRQRCIYYRYGDSEAEIDWIDDDTVVVNCQVIDVRNGQFNSKRESGYTARAPVSTLRTEDGRYRADVYEEYEGFGNSRTVTVYVDVTDTESWTSKNAYTGEKLPAGAVYWLDGNTLWINGAEYDMDK